MGELYYGNTPEPIHFPDRLLAHLKAVVGTKLRRNESFTISWPHEEHEAGGRSTIWVHPSLPLRFIFEDSEPEKLDPQLLQRLAADASSTSGILVIREESSDAEPAKTSS